MFYKAIFDKYMIKNKMDVLNAIDEAVEELNGNESPAKAKIAVPLLTTLKEKVIHTDIFDAPEYWFYEVSVDTYGAKLTLNHCDVFDDYGNDLGYTIDLRFCSVESKLITTEEFGEMHHVKDLTVRQWIRRGKIKNAKKIGDRWYIPELAEVQRDGLEWCEYSLDSGIVGMPEEYMDLLKYPSITISKDDADKFDVMAVGGGVIYTLSKSQKEKLELFLISHPMVHFEDSMLTYINHKSEYCEFRDRLEKFQSKYPADNRYEDEIFTCDFNDLMETVDQYKLQDASEAVPSSKLSKEEYFDALDEAIQYAAQDNTLFDDLLVTIPRENIFFETKMTYKEALAYAEGYCNWVEGMGEDDENDERDEKEYIQEFINQYKKYHIIYAAS